LELVEGEKKQILMQLEETLSQYEPKKENLIPILQQVQKGIGYLPRLAMEKIAEALEIPAVEVYGPATFYNQFRLHPPGDNQIEVCMGTACYMVGGVEAMESFERRLQIKEGETTLDRKFSLERVACVGCCTMAPVVVVNKKVEGHVTPTRVDGVLQLFENGKGEQDSHGNNDH
jgi:NADH-quinone oxidoreductase subunit E